MSVARPQRCRYSGGPEVATQAPHCSLRWGPRHPQVPALTFPMSTCASEPLQDMHGWHRVEGMPSRTHMAPRFSRVPRGGHRKEVSLQSEQQVRDPECEIRSGHREFAFKVEGPFKEQTGSETATGLSQVRAGGAPGCWTVRDFFFNLSPTGKPYAKTLPHSIPFTFHHPRRSYCRSEKLNFPQGYTARVLAAVGPSPPFP